MNIVLSIPFLYVFYSRLKDGSTIPFFLINEWIPWIIISALFSEYNVTISFLYLIINYLSFISIYEIGYIINDYCSSKFEEKGRLRGPVKVKNITLGYWIFIRLITFIILSLFLPFGDSQEWYLFYLILAIFFLFHNFTRNKELKVISFFWLAFLRFSAPVIFLLKTDSIISLALVASIIYIPFRFLSYLNSKGFLMMKNRSSPNFITIYFIAPALFSLVIYRNEHYSLYVILSIYYLFIGLIYFLINKFFKK